MQKTTKKKINRNGILFFCSDILINVSSVGWNCNLDVCVLFIVTYGSLLEYVYFVALYTASNGVMHRNSLLFTILFYLSLHFSFCFSVSLFQFLFYIFHSDVYSVHVSLGLYVSKLTQYNYTANVMPLFVKF